MTTLIPLHTLGCPHCHGKIALLETRLEQIVHGRLLSDTGAPFLVLVCTYCKHGFRYNYTERSSWVTMPAPLVDPSNVPIAFFFPTGCVDSNCTSQVELIAIRDAGTTSEDLVAEFPQWKLDGIGCEHGHPLLVPDPKKSP